MSAGASFLQRPVVSKLCEGITKAEVEILTISASRGATLSLCDISVNGT